MAQERVEMCCGMGVESKQFLRRKAELLEVTQKENNYEDVFENGFGDGKLASRLRVAESGDASRGMDF